jgi:hypothetical protein
MEKQQVGGKGPRQGEQFFYVGSFGHDLQSGLVV